ncbi:MAG: anhydro-N-acetylmuramic acid kinase [Planctomycetota bacterium]|nr:anhydro-N-acetylmuramic acid kinase [Planctomycetota bacterium]
MEQIRRKLEAGEARIGGVLSGTSADGIDVSVGRFGLVGGNLRLLEAVIHRTRPWPEDLGQRVRACLDGAPQNLSQTALLHRDLGRAFGRAVREVCEGEGRPLDLLGSHGQTVYHHDGVEPSGPASLQLGDGDFVAEEAGCPVVSDFRQADLAAGGQGAPLSGYADDVLFAGQPEPLCVLNLGGMANLTWLNSEQLLAFDTGPAGALLDGLARRHLGEPMDRDGAAAAAGAVLPHTLATQLDHPFFEEPLPKSTGRDTFGEAWIRAWGGPENSAQDLLATGVRLIAESVAQEMGRSLPCMPDTLWVAGGGVHNGALMDALQDALAARDSACKVVPSGDAGVDPDGREGLLFAVLAARWVMGQGVTRPQASGAASGRVLGKLSPGAVPPR